MNKLILLLALISVGIYAADNEIYVEQSGTTANLDLEQLGSGNIIGGLNSVAGTLTPFDLDGTSMTLDINQIAFESLRTPNAHCKIMLDPGAT